MDARLGRSALVLLVVAAVAMGACATRRASSPPKAIASVADIAGTWTGDLEFGAGSQPCTLTIEPGGRASITGRTMTASGQVTVQGGKATYSFPARSDGDVTLYEDGGKRQLHLKGRGGTFEAWVSPGGSR